MLSVVHREQRDRSQIPRLFASLANKAESEMIRGKTTYVHKWLLIKEICKDLFKKIKKFCRLSERVGMHHIHRFYDK